MVSGANNNRQEHAQSVQMLLNVHVFLTIRTQAVHIQYNVVV